ncbi:hypothetical protein IFM89_027330 [Coptis chinensis]|uniref:DUF4283 domain-containing protein n=1 Tax=Coptis chinensis TaxID=261450 RepID=A0A835M9T3_9MAGN|nr:hypothetical protein IFM89_027330 [Coptis chinensis]
MELTTDRDLFYFTFTVDEDRKIALEGGPIFIVGRIFIIRPWNVEAPTVPVWIKISNVPKELWTKNSKTHVIEVGEMEMSIGVEYPWKPSCCSTCMKFGHGTNKCNNTVVNTWIPRRNVNGQSSDADAQQTTRRIGQLPTQVVVQTIITNVIKCELSSCSSGAQGNETMVEELNASGHDTGVDPSIGLQLALYVPVEITTPIVLASTPTLAFRYSQGLLLLSDIHKFCSMLIQCKVNGRKRYGVGSLERYRERLNREYFGSQNTERSKMDDFALDIALKIHEEEGNESKSPDTASHFTKETLEKLQNDVERYFKATRVPGVEVASKASSDFQSLGEI